LIAVQHRSYSRDAQFLVPLSAIPNPVSWSQISRYHFRSISGKWLKQGKACRLAHAIAAEFPVKFPFLRDFD
jgi:hypothetical protein